MLAEYSIFTLFLQKKQLDTEICPLLANVPKCAKTNKKNWGETIADAGITNPHDMVEQITVYTLATLRFSGGGGANNVQIQIDKRMQLVLDSLKKRFAE